MMRVLDSARQREEIAVFIRAHHLATSGAVRSAESHASLPVCFGEPLIKQAAPPARTSASNVPAGRRARRLAADVGSRSGSARVTVIAAGAPPRHSPPIGFVVTAPERDQPCRCPLAGQAPTGGRGEADRQMGVNPASQGCGTSSACRFSNRHNFGWSSALRLPMRSPSRWRSPGRANEANE
jgi:hypothetical protein